MKATLSPEKVHKPYAAATKLSLVSLAATGTFWALIAFVIINLVLWQFNPFDRAASKDLWSGSGSIDLAVNDLAALKQRPAVVLLGSSLMMFPFWAMDKEANHKLPDIFHHHRSFALENELRSQGVKNPTVFNLAIFGQMASDAYIYADQFLKGDRAPNVVVLGIAPRDFSDADLPFPMATISFKRLVGLDNFWHYAPLYLPSSNDKADFLAGHACFFYGNRWHLQREFSKAISRLYAAIGIAAGQMQQSHGPAGFMLSGSNKQRWKNSLLEYQRRYRNIGTRDLTVQMSFIARLVQTCRQRGTKVIVLNMPLTDVNRQLFPAGFYDRFRQQIAALCKTSGATYLDLGDAADFVHEDFWDTTHLGYQGGHKLISHLLPVLLSVSHPTGSAKPYALHGQ